MIFEELSPNAEKLLNEIIRHKADDGSCDTDYWDLRFSELNFDDDTRLRGLFKELSSAELIMVRWADNVPYYLVVLDKGLSYADMKKAHEKAERRLSRREWKISVISAVIGAAVGLIPSIITWIGG